eukprot:CAMPEP_0175765074 /NCGR_PEP_ID=MMETSP0097-20121207/68614_1 /TAXON_ID=311494 /ORGANISM="Alexandrium monilatum, Strain CCMP3105" /LENGTH=179 /DNA_ID=CAMNT_0017074921 /DNA_START=37 /DNA_END=573 /DNA_ORIENTATION=-
MGLAGMGSRCNEPSREEGPITGAADRVLIFMPGVEAAASAVPGEAWHHGRGRSLAVLHASRKWDHCSLAIGSGEAGRCRRQTAVALAGEGGEAASGGIAIPVSEVGAAGAVAAVLPPAPAARLRLSQLLAAEDPGKLPLHSSKTFAGTQTGRAWPCASVAEVGEAPPAAGARGTAAGWP